jgi:uncharacterized protein YbaR (Trm112 family)
MFIELTDHLRCPVEHDEAYLVLLPDAVEGRSVRAGTLGCPVCDRRFTVTDGVLDVGGAPGDQPDAEAGRLGAEAIAPLVGLNGPGGYLVLVGGPAGGWRELAGMIPGVALVAVNPPRGVEDVEGLSVLRGGRLPLKTGSMRGVVLGTPFGGERGWVAEAARVVLPGLRIVGEGETPPPELIDVLATAGGVWVGTRRR